ncbi:MAG: ShlB/FhaC/HecB family hemolysin secretion/activation protein [Pseudomonadales bacterium]
MKNTTLLILLSGLVPLQVLAAPVAPDGGTIQQSAPVISSDILPDADIDFSRPLPATAEDQGNGRKVKIERVEFSGHTVFSTEQLNQVIEEELDREHSFIGLKNLATRITRHYRQMGYLMATAYLPQQDISDNVLKVEILEGILGELTVDIDGRMSADRLRRYFDSLEDKPLTSAQIERKLRLLTDRGVKVQGTFSPGESLGSTNFNVKATEQPLLQGNVSVDNKGNRYTNAVRAGTVLQLNDPAGYGGRYLLSLVSGGAKYRYVALDGDVPIGYDGLAVKFGYSNTHYELGEEFAALDAEGKSDNFKVGLHYPWRRSLNSNIYSDINYRLSRFDDETLGTATSDRKIKSVDASLFGDFSSPGKRTDWRFKVEAGDVEDKAQNDPTEGGFAKLELSLKHNQFVFDKFRVQGSISGQHTNDNLSSAHKFALGGADAVRAYPQGEGLVDTGILSSLEIFYQANPSWTFSGFVDAGVGDAKKHPSASDTDNTKALSGIGAAAVFRHKSLGNLSMTAAWRTDSEATTAPDRQPRLWLQWTRPFN